MLNKTTQKTPWGTIVSEEWIIPGERLKSVLHYRSKSILPHDHVSSTVEYLLNDGRFFCARKSQGKYVLVDSLYNQLGEFPDRVAMTKWVKTHLVNKNE